MTIRNRIDEVLAAMPGAQYARRQKQDIDTVMIHRIEPSEMGRNLGLQIEPSVVGLARAFTDPRTHIGKMAYSILIKPDGQIEQALPLSYVSPHGKRWNFRAVGVAWVGDFTREPPTGAQMAAGEWLLRWLVQSLCPKHSVTFDGAVYPCMIGHTEAPDSTSDPDKVCPGDKLPMGELRARVFSLIQDDAWTTMSGVGAVF